MIDKIINLVKQMSDNEKESLLAHIKRQYILEEKKGMLRDEAKERVLKLLHTSFNHIMVIVNENDSLEKSLDLDAVDITGFTEKLLKEFDLEGIEFSEVMEWVTVSDIINTVVNSLENQDEQDD